MSSSFRSFSRTLPLQFLIVSVSFLSVPSASAEDFMLPGLRGTVEVFEDQYGIPTIKADAPLDAATVQGYLQARDRYFQMDFNRKLAAGRLAELIGEGALSNDIEFRTLGLDRAALKTWQALDADTKGWLQAYSNGVNAYVKNNPLPPEYVALELTQTEPWTPLDSVLLGKLLAASFSLNSIPELEATVNLLTYVGVGEVVGFDGEALFFEDTHRSEPPDDRVTAPEFLGQAGPGRTQAVDADVDRSKPLTRAGKRLPAEGTLELAQKVLARWDQAPLFKASMQNYEYPKGSNAWLVSGEHTASGYPMIANDPHLTMDTPPIWYENHLIYTKDGKEWNVNGTSFSGTPGVVLGCSSFACWGLTVNPLDITDVFTEDILTNALTLPTHTLYKGNPEPITQVYQNWFVNVVGDEVPDNLVNVNFGLGAGNPTLVVPRRNDGPIAGIIGGQAISIMYSGFRDTHEFTSFLDMNRAESLDEFVAALQNFDIAVQNVYYADVLGNIAWFTTSEKPLREDLANFTIDGVPPWIVRDGTGAAANEWLPVMNPQPKQALDYEMLPFNEMPQLVNPAKGFVTNANNDPVGVSLDNVPFNEIRPSGNGLYYLNSHYSSYRMGRVDREIKAAVEDGGVSVEDFKKLQGNVEMLDAELVLPTLLGIMSQVPVPPGTPMADALALLAAWDYSAPTGLAEGWDAGDDPVLAVPPSDEEIRNSAAATIWTMWRSMLVRNTIYANLEARGMGDNLPPSSLAYNSFKHHLENYQTAGGVGASGINFFPLGLGETVAGSLQQALERLASDEFAAAFANSADVLDYRWGKLHRIVFDHPFNQDPFNVPNGGGFMDLSADLRGLARQGGYEVVDASGHSATANSLDGFMFGSGPARRFVGTMTPSGPVAEQVIPGGQSGVFLSPNYASQLPLWLVNDYHDMALTTEDAADVSVRAYTFAPAQ